jgi:hypothetical protein
MPKKITNSQIQNQDLDEKLLQHNYLVGSAHPTKLELSKSIDPAPPNINRQPPIKLQTNKIERRSIILGLLCILPIPLFLTSLAMGSVSIPPGRCRHHFAWWYSSKRILERYYNSISTT